MIYKRENENSVAVHVQNSLKQLQTIPQNPTSWQKYRTVHFYKTKTRQIHTDTHDRTENSKQLKLSNNYYKWHIQFH